MTQSACPLPPESAPSQSPISQPPNLGPSGSESFFSGPSPAIPTTSSTYDGWSLGDRNPHVIRTLLPYSTWLYRYYFHVTSDGWEHMPEGPVLVVGSHNGGLASPDLHMFMTDWFCRFGVERPAYGLMHPLMWRGLPHLAKLATQMGAIQAHPKMAIAALKHNASVLVYPGGAQDVFRPHHQRHQICFNGRKGFIKLALRQQVPIIPLISTGAHDTLFVLDNCYDQAKYLHDQGVFPWLLGLDPEVFPLYLGLPWGLALGPLPNIPWPSPVHLRVCPAITFPYYGRDAVKDPAYVDQCYQIVVEAMQTELNALST